MSPSSDFPPANDEAIEAMAAAWLVQKDEGFTPEQAAEFARWRAAHPRHAAAVAMLEETCGILSRLPALQPELEAEFAAEAPPSAGVAPRGSDKPANVIHFPRWAGVAVAALAACLVFAFVQWRRTPAALPAGETYATTDRGYERVVLADQSVLELNANTELRVTFTDRLREVVLTRGEAHFTVAKNAARPFVVGAGRVAVRAVGTDFNVRRATGAVEVLVTEGRVQVSQATVTSAADASADTATPDKPLLGAGQRILVADGTPDDRLAALVTTIDPAAAPPALAWHNPLLTFDATPLAEVVRRFNQHNRVQLEIGDPELADRAVGGTFYANNVEVFVSLLEKSRDIAVERPDAQRIVLRKFAR